MWQHAPLSSQQTDGSAAPSACLLPHKGWHRSRRTRACQVAVQVRVGTVKAAVAEPWRPKVVEPAAATAPL